MTQTLQTNIEGLVRDGRSNAILNTDNVAYAAYKQRRRSRTELDQLKEEVATLSSSINQIKSLLEAVLREHHK